MLNSKLKIALATTALVMGAYAGAARAEGYCSAGKTITFAGIDWESGSFITEVMKEILSKGYDCKVDSIPGNSVTLEQATANNDVQIFAEEWIGRSDVWNKAAEAGQVKSVGKTFVGAAEGWFVPEYLVKGDPAKGIAAKAPDLKSVDQLSDPKIVELFRDPEEPTKGRFLNCPSGWTCEGVNTAKLASGLQARRQLCELPPRHRHGARCRNRRRLPPGRADAVLLLEPDGDHGQIQAHPVAGARL